MNTIHEITQMLLDQSRREAAQILADARAEADGLLVEADLRAQAEAVELRDQYRRREQEFERREQLNERMQKRRMLLRAKQELIDRAIERVRERFLGQTDAEWIDLLAMLLSRNHRPGQGDIPEIVVPARLADAARAALDPRYPVRAAPLRHGFLFSFQHYDLNYEAQRLFNYQSEKFEREARLCLFGGGGDE